MDGYTRRRLPSFFFKIIRDDSAFALARRNLSILIALSIVKSLGGSRTRFLRRQVDPPVLLAQIPSTPIMPIEFPALARVRCYSGATVSFPPNTPTVDKPPTQCAISWFQRYMLSRYRASHGNAHIAIFDARRAFNALVQPQMLSTPS